MTSPNPWHNLIEVPEAYSGTQSKTSYTSHWDRKTYHEDAGTAHRPILIETDDLRSIAKSLRDDVKSETKPDESKWMIVVLSEPTSGPASQYLFFADRHEIGHHAEHITWGQSLESECPWIQEFNIEYGSKSSVTSLKRMFVELSKLLENKNFEQVDRIFRLADIQKYNLDFTIGLLRATYKYRSSLPSWKSWLRETEMLLVRAGEDAEAELVGLK